MTTTKTRTKPAPPATRDDTPPATRDDTLAALSLQRLAEAREIDPLPMAAAYIAEARTAAQQISNDRRRDQVLDRVRDEAQILGHARAEDRGIREGADPQLDAAIHDGDLDRVEVILAALAQPERAQGQPAIIVREPDALAEFERTALEAHELTIARGLQTFYAVGGALAAIRDDRLYRQSHRTFEDYCRDRWNMGRNYVNKLVAASEVVQHLGTTVPILPTTERQARPLAAVPPAQQAEVWTEAVETAPAGKVTAAHVQRVVDTHLAPAPDATQIEAMRARWLALGYEQLYASDRGWTVYHPKTGAGNYKTWVIVEEEIARKEAAAAQKAPAPHPDLAAIRARVEALGGRYVADPRPSPGAGGHIHAIVWPDMQDIPLHRDTATVLAQIARREQEQQGAPPARSSVPPVDDLDLDPDHAAADSARYNLDCALEATSESSAQSYAARARAKAGQIQDPDRRAALLAEIDAAMDQQAPVPVPASSSVPIGVQVAQQMTLAIRKQRVAKARLLEEAARLARQDVQDDDADITIPDSDVAHAAFAHVVSRDVISAATMLAFRAVVTERTAA